MNEAILIFTFGPVQSFIQEARRTSDLFAGSQILVDLARAAARSLAKDGALIYPADIETSRDTPNKLVAAAPWDEVEGVTERASRALAARWQAHVEAARKRFRAQVEPPFDEGRTPAIDTAWEEIWRRQTTGYWDIYWAAAMLDGRSYAAAYEEAMRVLEASKRTRAFAPGQEPDIKDTLSGRRQALRTASLDARKYWKEVGARVSRSRLRPEGRERLDALGVVKRFGSLAQEQSFNSTSTVSAAGFLEEARRKAAPQLTAYRHAVERLLGSGLYRVRDADWPYDGNLFYRDTLTPRRLEDDYGARDLDPGALREALSRLGDLYRQTGWQPSPYYAVVRLDGDDMGKWIDTLLQRPDPRAEHARFSQKLVEFSQAVRPIVEQRQGTVVYNGGDDVLLLAPKEPAVMLAQQLAERFHAVTGRTASAGVAIAHFLYPLDAVLQAAHEAEQSAKAVPDKGAVGVRVLRRSGEHILLRARWAAVAQNLPETIELFRAEENGEALATRFAYEVLAAARTLTTADARFEAELRRLLSRHSRRIAADSWARRLHAWAEALPEGPEGLGHWLVFARFLAQKGDAE